MLLEKPLPSSESAERTVLGAILVDNKMIAQAAESLVPEDFYSPFYRQIFRAMLNLFARSQTIDPIMIGEELKLTGANLDAFGGIAAITNLSYGIPGFSDISEWTGIVKDKSKIRDLVQVCSDCASRALADAEEAGSILNYAQSRINEVCVDAQKQGFSSVGSLALASVREKIRLRDENVIYTGFQTGFAAIDSATGGLQKKELIVLGARPGMGKTSLVVNIAENGCAIQTGAVIAVFSLEMGRELLTDRMLCSSARVNSNRYRRGLVTDNEFGRVAEAAARFADYRIEIDDTPAMSPSQVRAKAMMLKAKYKRLDLIIVDFLQKMSPSRRAESVRHEIGSIARELKDLAKTLDVPVLAISSLNRDCESRNPPRPLMSDLAESNVIESEADIVVFLYREHYYRPQEASPYKAELIFEKNRNGETGTRELAWIGEFTRFEDC
jgi:replicative DNA helicase